MGILMPVGFVLTNAIVFIDLTEKLRKQEMPAMTPWRNPGVPGWRPVLMTALTTMIAMLPIAIGPGEGTVLSAEPAIVVIGGPLSSTLLALPVITVICSLMVREKQGTAEEAEPRSVLKSCRQQVEFRRRGW
jgi:HAE1 family hydrophobic/amphiphilic exporter-1